MNIAHLHLILNHFPLIGSVIGLLILLEGYYFNNSQIKRTALRVFILSAIVAAIAFITGDPAEESIKNQVGVNGKLIEVHEQRAIVYLISVAALGLISFITLLGDVDRKSFRKPLYITIIGLSVLVIIISQWMATAGGEIRHPEINKQQNMGPTEMKSDD